MGTARHHHTILKSALLASTLLLASCGAFGSTQSEVGTNATSVEAATNGELAAGAEAATALVDDAAAVDTAAATTENQESHFDTDDVVYDESEVVAVSLSGSSASADSDAVVIDGTTVTIVGEGVYEFSGTLDDGQIVVDADDEHDVTLVLDGVDVTNADGAAIAVMNADEAIVLLAEGSTNRLTDGAKYTFADAETDEPNATLFSTADLAIAGDGELIVTANYNDGITSKDGLVIDAGAITVVAADDGIRGKDYVVVNGGVIAIEAAGDGIKSDNEDDAERGYVLVSGGLLDINAGDDGIQAATDILITDGQVDIDAGSGSGTGRALQGDVMVWVSGGELDMAAVDDAIHSNDAVTIDGGTLTIAAGDDGIHGDYSVTINSGSITITDSFEGIESEVITINDGVIDVTANDDGLNVASAEAAAVAETAPVGGGRGGGGGAPDDNVGEHYIYINGGSTSITITGALAEQGDGIDANGHVVMTGGVVSVSGPTDTRNSAIDYSGGSFTMTGGLFIGTNIDGRNSEGIGTGSSQASLYVSGGSTISGGTVVHIESDDGESLVTFEPVNDFSVIVFSSPDLVAGASYDIYLGGAVTGVSTTGLYEVADYTAGELAATVTANL